MTIASHSRHLSYNSSQNPNHLLWFDVSYDVHILLSATRLLFVCIRKLHRFRNRLAECNLQVTGGALDAVLVLHPFKVDFKQLAHARDDRMR